MLWTSNFISTCNNFVVTFINVWTKLHDLREWMIKWASQKSSCFIVISIFFLETDEELIFSFTLAALVGDPSLLIELLDAGVPADSADKYSIMALWREAHSNRTDVSPVLLQGGADVDQWSSQFHSTVIHEAARKNNTNVIKLLLKHGASTKLEECNGRTPIDTARECNNNASCNFFFRLLEGH